MGSLDLNTDNLMSNYNIVVTFKHSRIMRLRYHLAGWVMVIVAKLMSANGFRFEPLDIEPNCDCGRCGNACAYVEPYGWVPEAGCSVHDSDESNKYPPDTVYVWH